MKRMQKIAVALATMGLASQSWGAGFEKSVSWSGKHVGVGGAAVSRVQGAESLFFNPAGLAGAPGIDLSANFSPTFTKAEGPLVENSKSVAGTQQFSPVFGLLSSYAVTPDLGAGVGVFVTGGTKAVYEGVDYSGLNSEFTIKGNAKSDLSLIEISPGVGYRLADGLKVGAAWRVSLVKGAFSSAQATDLKTVNPALPDGSYLAQSVNVDGLSGQAYSGFRVGAQWAPEGANWGLGLNVRTPIKFTLKGTSSGTVQYRGGGALAAGNALNADVKNLTGAAADVSSQLPTQVALGGHWDVADRKVGLFFEYVWTNYSAVKSIAIASSVTTPSDVINDAQKTALGATGQALGAALNDKTSALPDFATAWFDQNQIRLGSEFRYIENWPLRVGYVLTSQVVPGGNARATFSSPGLGHTFAFGTGSLFADNKLGFDVSFEYSLASGSSVGSAQAKAGDYKTRALGIHTGLAYAF